MVQMKITQLPVWVFGGTLQQGNVLRFLIMTPYFNCKLIYDFIKIPFVFSYRLIMIRNTIVFFGFNRIILKGGDGREILLNSGKEVISF